MYQQGHQELLGQKSASFIWGTKVCMNLNGTEWLVEMDWKNFEKDQKSFEKKTIAQKMKFSIKDFFSKCDQIRRKLRIWSHLLK